LGKNGSILAIDTISKYKIKKKATTEDALRKAKSRITREENKLKKTNHTTSIKARREEKKFLIFLLS
jgi:hypothetical protein